MIKIEFEQKSKEEILIFGIDEKQKRKEIGRIMTPAGSGSTNINAIQICGWDECFDLWGCGVYGDKRTNQMKKDIQLIWFDNYDKMNREEMDKIKVGEKIHNITKEQMKRMKLKEPFYIEKIMKNRFDIGKDCVCHHCYNHPCTCEVKIRYENPFTVKREQDVRPNTKKEYEEAVKYAILNALEEKK